MKKHSSVILLTTLSLLGATALPGQQPFPRNTTLMSAAAADPRATSTPAQAMPTPASDGASSGRGGFSSNFSGGGGGGGRRGYAYSGKAVVIRQGGIDSKVQENLESDLPVMQRLLDRVVGYQRAMGITVVFSPSSGQSRTLYLEDYGALFFLQVNYPLLPPPNEADKEPEKPGTDSAWEDVKRELYGVHDDRSSSAGPVEDYDADKVNQLKDSLLETLKSATNIRGLKLDNWITVSVFGTTSGAIRTRPAVTSTASPTTLGGALATRGITTDPNDSNAQNWAVLSGGNVRQTTLTIRVKKSDVDAYASGKFNLDEFRKKANINIYAGDAGGATSITYPGGSGRRGGLY